MFKKVLYAALGDRYRFRHITFDELAELYTSTMLRSMAMSMSGIFVPIFLFDLNYPIWQIMLFYCIVFLASFLFSFPAAKLVGNIGPKHSMLISYFVQIAVLFGLIQLESLPELFYPVAFGLGVANIIFFTSFHINFSKVKHRRSSGNELGWVYIMERVGGVLGPVLGGLLAMIFAPSYTFAVSISLLLFAAVPLLLTKEVMKTHQKLNFAKLRAKNIRSDTQAYSFFAIDAAVSMTIWPLFVGAVIFKDNPYFLFGTIMSISVVVSVVIARMVGKVVDNRQGRLLMRFNLVVNALLHLFRPFSFGYASALSINMVNDGVTAGYRMPFLKGMYSSADDHPGSRIVYIAIMEAHATFVRMAFFGLAALLAYSMTTSRLYFGILFAVGAVASLLVMVERFPALNKRRRQA